MDAVRVVTLAPGVIVETPHATLHLLAPDAHLPARTDVHFALPHGDRVAYAPRAPSSASPREIRIDEPLHGNAFRALHESDRAFAALLSIAAARRVDSGPESERVFVHVRGNGLVFLENGDTMRFEPGQATVAPAGEPARLWAQGPTDALVVALQPRMAPAERRTLLGEVKKRRAEE